MTSILKSTTGSRPIGEIRKGKMFIKGEEGATKRGQEVLREKPREEQERENYTS